MNPYVKLGVTIGVSTFLMYWLMYVNVFQLNHVFFSQTRLYMALIMGSVMAFIMLLFMWGMYKNKKLNAIILNQLAMSQFSREYDQLFGLSPQADVRQ
ncbi:hypothetical protein [Exiguobacterium sp.]|uniref:hypothetical protein n=1 Tax=Exiguobacterium sp. TaxID=44751 RepID=UPI0034506BD1